MALIVNEQVVPDHELERELLQLSSGLQMDAPHAGGVDPEYLRSIALRNVVRRTLLLQAAAARKLSVTPAEVDAERGRRWGSSSNSTCGTGVTAAIEQDMLLQRISADLTRHVPRASRADSELFYRRNPHLYHLPEAVEAAHIQCGAATPDEERTCLAKLEKAEEELRKGRAFSRVADEFSDCKSVGGSLGWVVRGQMVQEFEEVVFQLKPGARSDVFRTVFGLHIATVTRRRVQGMVPFDQVRLQVAGKLFADARERHLAALVARMEAESDIRFTEEAPHG